MRMRIKNFTLLFIMGFFGLFAFQAQAQQDSTIDPADIRFWIGEGENQAILAVNWNEPDTCLAWGFRFGENPVTVKEMMFAIAEADYRFSFDAPTNFVNDIMFNDGVVDLSVTEFGYMMFCVNGEMSAEYYDTKVIVNGDFVKWGDTNCGTMIDPVYWIYVWESPVVAVYPLADEAVIDEPEILNWVGEGENEVILAVNWADPDTCLAWGYRFDDDYVTVETVMDAIVEKDGRFGYLADNGYLMDITFDAGSLHLALVGPYWWMNVNGGGAWYGYTEQQLVSGDFVKWGDVACATEIGPWNYVWETPVHPASNNTGLAESVNTVALYPNPASSYTMVSVRDMSSNAMVTVADLQGRVLRRFTVTHSEEPIRIETVDFVPGVYFVTVTDGMTRPTAKLTVK